MPTALQIGDQVYVPRNLLGENPSDAVSPFHRTIVRAHQNRSIQVDMPRGGLSRWIASAKVHLNLGILIIRIGDYNEQGLIDPLYKSVLHFCRILLLGELVRAIEVRTRQELRHLWNAEHRGCQQVVLIGHGSATALQFGETDVGAESLRRIFERPNPAPKEFISLCCQTGEARGNL